MTEVIVDVVDNPQNYEFNPNFASGDFDWDGEKFIPEE
jgi:hypothetical protein